MKVVAYVRVSTEEQANQGHSLPAQEAKLRSYCQTFDHELVAVIVDAGQSAKSLNRPGLAEALAMLKSGQAEGLLVAKLDRLTRSVRDLGDLIERTFQKSTLMSVAEQVDTSSAGGRMMLNLMTVMSQWEREVIGERTSTALQFKKSQGAKLGQPVHEASPAGAQAATRARELKAQGRPLREIASALQAEGYATKRGGGWAPQTVRLLLGRA